jgi:hypothetical protein
MDRNLELEELQREVITFYNKLEVELGEQMEIDCKIFYSQFPFDNDTDILFIGINPGTGETGIGHDVKPMSNFAYLDWGNSVTVSRETIEIFELAEYSNLLKDLDKNNKVVKTNLYYFATRGLSKLNDYLNNKFSASLREEFKKNSIKWTSKIIELTNPKIIIYEGTTAFNQSPPFYDNNILENFNDGDVFYCRLNNNNLAMIGYSRQHKNRDIIKEKFAKILKIELDKIYK